jgi:hypothetical protein
MMAVVFREVAYVRSGRTWPPEDIVVWRRPGASVSKALSKVDFGPGDRVVCFEWFGSGSEDTKLRCLMEREADHGETTVYARVQG